MQKRKDILFFENYVKCYVPFPKRYEQFAAYCMEKITFVFRKLVLLFGNRLHSSRISAGISLKWCSW